MTTKKEKLECVRSFLDRHKSVQILNREIAYCLETSLWSIHYPNPPKSERWGLYENVANYEAAPKRKFDLSILTKHEKLQLLYDLKASMI